MTYRISRLQKIRTKIEELRAYLAASRRLGEGPLQSALLFYLFLGLYVHDYARLLYRILPLPRTVRLKPEGSAGFSLRIPGDITFVVALSEIFVKNAYTLELPEPPGTILDIGANFGVATAFFAMRYPGARIYAFEPAAGNYAYLAANAAQFPNVETLNTAVYSRSGMLRLYTPKGAGGWNSFYGTGAEHEDVKCVTLDSFMETRGLNSADLVKIDVEGAEWEILKDCRSLARIKAMVGELHFSIIDKEKMLALLERYFSLTILDFDTPGRPVFKALAKNRGER